MWGREWIFTRWAETGQASLTGTTINFSDPRISDLRSGFASTEQKRLAFTMPTRPSALLPHQQTQLQRDSSLIESIAETSSPSTTIRQYCDPDALPRPDYFESLNELHTWYELRFGDATDDHLELCSLHKGPRRDQPSVTGSHPAPTLSQGGEARRPRLAVCHDFQGGYNERPDARGYSFEHFHLVDTLIYFSHKRVTVPPVGWLLSARRAGTKVLGTLIFEWKESVPDLSQLLRGPERKAAGLRGPLTFSPQYAVELIELALERGFWGYLVNVEVSLDLGFACSGEPWPAWVGEQARHAEMCKNAERLRAWVCYLRDEGRRRFQEAGKPADEWEVMWYDSVVYPQGQLNWQDALTPNNVDFFQAADTFFSNYTWARPPQAMPPGRLMDPNEQGPEWLQWQGYGLTGPGDGGFHPSLLLSAAMADSLESYTRDSVFVGIDVFGRNCWGGMQTWKSLAMIGPQRFAQPVHTGPPNSDLALTGDALGLSVALFAPGWTWEHSEPDANGRTWKQWWQEDCKLWLGEIGVPPDLIPIQTFFLHSASDSIRLQRRANSEQAAFYTNFALGSGLSWHVQGEQVYSWSNVQSMSSAKLGGWTDMGAWMPKPDLLFADICRQGAQNQQGVVERWWLDEKIVFDGNVALGLDLRRAAIAQKIPLCSFTVLLDQGEEQTWTFQIAVKREAKTKTDVLPFVICHAMTITCDDFDFQPAHGDWQIGSAKARLGGDLPLAEPVLVSLGVRIRQVESRASVWIGALAFSPDGLHDRSDVLSMSVVPGPTRILSDGNPLLTVSLQWPPSPRNTAYYNVWLQQPGNAISRIWLGTSTREATKDEFCILGLDAAGLFPGLTELQIVATPLGLMDSAFATATLVV